MTGHTGGVDILPLVTLLARVEQAISGIFVKLMEHQAGVGEFPESVLLELADQLTWVSHVIRQNIARQRASSDPSGQAG